MPFVRMAEEAFYEYRVSEMLISLRRSVLNGDFSQDSVFSYVDLSCSRLPFPDD